MKVSELRRLLDTVAKLHPRDDYEVVIRTAISGQGGNVTMDIYTAAVGGDWLAGKVLLYPREDLISAAPRKDTP